MLKLKLLKINFRKVYCCKNNFLEIHKAMMFIQNSIIKKFPKNIVLEL